MSGVLRHDSQSQLMRQKNNVVRAGETQPATPADRTRKPVGGTFAMGLTCMFFCCCLGAPGVMTPLIVCRTRITRLSGGVGLCVRQDGGRFVFIFCAVPEPVLGLRRKITPLPIQKRRHVGWGLPNLRKAREQVPYLVSSVPLLLLYCCVNLYNCVDE